MQVEDTYAFCFGYTALKILQILVLDLSRAKLRFLVKCPE